MNRFHQEILQEIERNSGKGAKRVDEGKYVGTSHFMYKISVPQTRLIARSWAKRHRDISFTDYLDLLTSLNCAPSHQEVSFVGKLLELFPEWREKIDPKVLDKWLSNTKGWAEVDSTCQNIFTAGEMLVSWTKWKKLLRDFSTNNDVHKRRASLVLLTGPVTYSADERLADLALENIEKLKSERSVLITKAVSWLLRSLIKNHRESVEKYLQNEKESLPKIAVREVSNKLRGGKKSGNK